MRGISPSKVFNGVDPASASFFSGHSQTTLLPKNQEMEFETMDFERPSDQKYLVGGFAAEWAVVFQ
eukprot:641386-Amphidinium_carterae.1